MAFGAQLVSTTLGRVLPRYKTLNQWVEVYTKIIDSKAISDKTKANRRSAVTHIVGPLGGRVISTIRPHEIAILVQGIRDKYPQAAKRVLIEAKDMFGEDVNYGYLDRNPALQVKSTPVKIQRRRLTLDQWIAIEAYASVHMPPWISMMLYLALLTGQRRSDLCRMKFTDVWDGVLHVEQMKTGTRVALPLHLRIDEIGMSLGDIIERCKMYAVTGEYLLRKHNGCQLGDASLSARFEMAREKAIPPTAQGTPPSLHECRSLAERIYREKGWDTRKLLGHKDQKMTDMYNNMRGFGATDWELVTMKEAPRLLN